MMNMKEAIRKACIGLYNNNFYFKTERLEKQ